MTNLFLRWFVPNHQNTADPAVRGAVGKLAGVTGIVCNCLLFLCKLLTGLFTGSISILADAFNNLSDAASSILTVLGFHLSQRPADTDHPYGHARYEYLSALAVAVLILLLGIELVKSSVQKLLHPEPAEFTAVSFVLLLLCTAVKLWMSRFYGKLGKHIRSAALQAPAVDSRNDCIITAAVLAGSLIQHLWGIQVDGFVGLAVALFILYSGISLAKTAISPLLGQRADADLTRKLTALVLSEKKILGIHKLLIHDYGPGQYFATVHAEIDAAEDPIAAHAAIDALEHRALKELHVQLVIHYDPLQLTDPA